MGGRTLPYENIMASSEAEDLNWKDSKEQQVLTGEDARGNQREARELLPWSEYVLAEPQALRPSPPGVTALGDGAFGRPHTWVAEPLLPCALRYSER